MQLYLNFKILFFLQKILTCRSGLCLNHYSPKGPEQGSQRPQESLTKHPADTYLVEHPATTCMEFNALVHLLESFWSPWK